MADRLIYATADALDAATGARAAEAGTIAEETKLVLRRLEATLAESGCTLGDIAKAVCYLGDDAHRMEFWGAYGEVMGAHGATRLTLGAGLEPGARVLLDVIAERPA
jgi:2-iminobutanoate/2-iminopropanoate deaminase